MNNGQAVQWLSEFCEKYNYSIVVTSTWRFNENYQDCLRRAGLRKNIKILGRTPSLRNIRASRGDEIEAYLKENKGIKSFIILDDENDMGQYQDRLVQCKTSHGFGMEEYFEAEKLHKLLNDKKG